MECTSILFESGQDYFRTVDLQFQDNVNLVFGNGGDATIDYNGTHLIIDPQVVGSGNLLINAGSIDLNNQGSLINVGAAGNDWTATTFAHSGSGLSNIERTTASTNAIVASISAKTKSAGDASDGFGSAIRFDISDTGVTDSFLGLLAFERAGADNTSDFLLRTNVAGVNNDAFKVSSLGLGSFDLAGAGDGIPSLFDDYDDPKALKQFAHIVAPDISEEQREANLKLMLDMGIVSEVPGSMSGYHINIQPILRLLSGGIYQLDARLKALEG